MDAPAQWLVPTQRFRRGTVRGAVTSRMDRALNGPVALSLTSSSPTESRHKPKQDVCHRRYDW
jgi:hypothetical protein